MKHVRIGALRHRVDLAYPNATSTPGGGATLQWQTFATVWASMTPARGQESVHADGLRSTTTFHVVIRYRNDVTTACRIQHAGEQLDIRAVYDPDGRRRWLVCQCQSHEE